MKRKLIIFSGLSGSGNSTIMKELLDLDYLIISSLEAKYDDYYNVINNMLKHTLNKEIAIFLNITNKEEFRSNYNAIKKIKEESSEFDITQIFLTCQKDVLENRYQENRKQHPYIIKNSVSMDIKSAITQEKEITNEFKSNSDYVIDTSSLVPSESKKIFKSYIEESSDFVINLISFGFKHGMYFHSDFVFDVRSLPNPYYKKELRNKTGLDKEVRDYVFSTDEALELQKSIIQIIKTTIPGYKKVNKESLTIAIACTGGQHRSVSFVYRLTEELKKDYKINTIHVERDRGHWHD